MAKRAIAGQVRASYVALNKLTKKNGDYIGDLVGKGLFDTVKVSLGALAACSHQALTCDTGKNYFSFRANGKASRQASQ